MNKEQEEILKKFEDELKKEGYSIKRDFVFDNDIEFILSIRKERYTYGITYTNQMNDLNIVDFEKALNEMKPQIEFFFKGDVND